MKILITGANGQLGQALQAVLRDHQLIALDIDEIDITQLESTRKVISQGHPDLVINAAAYTDVDGAESNSDAAFRVNALGPRNLALLTASQRIPLVHISTDYVFDGVLQRPYHEFDRPNPISVYGRSKLAGEEALRALNPRHFIIRTSWLYHIIGKNFPKTIWSLSKEPKIRVVSDQYGSPTYAPHLANAIAQLIKTDACGTYHVAGSGGTSWFELARALFKLLQIQTPIVPVSTAEFPRPAYRPRYAVLTSLQDPTITLPPWEEGIAEFAQGLRTGS